MTGTSDRSRWFHTINIYFITLTYGIAVSVYGASLIDIAEIYGSNVEIVSYTLMTRGVGSIFASLIGTAVYEFCNGQLLLLGCVFYGGLASFLATLLPALVYFHVLTFGLGTAMGFIEIGIHVWMQSLWREKSGPFFHFLNFIFGFGGILAPFLCEPFLSPLKEDNVTLAFDNYSNASIPDTPYLNGSDSSNATLTGWLEPLSEPQSESRVFIAYCLITGIYALNAISMIISFCLDGKDFKPSKENSYFEAKLPKRQRLTVLVLFAFYLTVGVICEFGFSQMITTFAVRYEPLRFSKSSAAYLTSMFWTSYTLSRMISTGLSLKLGPAQLIGGSQAIYLSGMILMVLFVDRSPWVAWAGTAVVAFGMAPYWANGSTWVVQYIQLTHGYMSATMVVVSSGIMLVPLIIGSRIEQNPASFLYSNAALAILLTIIGFILIAYGRTRILRTHKHKICTHVEE